MKDIIIIPSSWRPEFLHMCLESIAQCPEVNGMEIWVVQDHKQRDDAFPQAITETQEIIAHWKSILGKRLLPILRPTNEYYGNTYNVLSAYNRAFKTDAQYVYMIEDDIVVTKDFFKWHMWAQKIEDCFCSIAINPKDNTYLFRSLGVCWKRENLASIIEHYKPEYFATDQNMVDYVWNLFPDSVYGYKFIEQDGLISRIMERDKKTAVWSNDPKAYHIGLWGYHRSIGLEAMEKYGLIGGSLFPRIEKLKKLLHNQDWINSVADFQTDIQVLP